MGQREAAGGAVSGQRQQGRYDAESGRAQRSAFTYAASLAKDCYCASQ